MQLSGKRIRAEKQWLEKSTIGAVNNAGPKASPQPLSPSSPTISTSMVPRRSYQACE